MIITSQTKYFVFIQSLFNSRELLAMLRHFRNKINNNNKNGKWKKTAQFGTRLLSYFFCHSDPINVCFCAIQRKDAKWIEFIPATRQKHSIRKINSSHLRLVWVYIYCHYVNYAHEWNETAWLCLLQLCLFVWIFLWRQKKKTRPSLCK